MIMIMTATNTATTITVKMIAVSLCQILINQSFVVLKFSLQKYIEEVRLALSGSV